MRILQLSAEAAPFAKTGGLGDMVAGLTRHLARAGHDVRLCLPLYPALAAESHRFVPLPELAEVTARLGAHEHTFSGFTAPFPGGGPEVIFLGCPALFGEGGIYLGDRLDSLRFPLFLAAVLSTAKRLGWAPDVVHCHDWHTALLPLLLRTVFRDEPFFAGTRTVLTLHNLAYQGSVYAKRLTDLGLEAFDPLAKAEGGRFNLLKHGILHADALTTVSRTYAREIQEPGQGEGLEDLLRTRSADLVGIVNGADPQDWNPEADPFLPAPYSAADLSGKRICKGELLRELGFEGDPDVPVAAVVARMTLQKGVDLCCEVLPPFLERGDLRLVSLGSGHARCEDLFQDLARRFPGRVWYSRDYQEERAHRILAGADLFLMPSRYEPCGLTQLYSLRYGTPPVARRTGGLADTLEPFDPATDEGTGFLFGLFSAESFAGALEAALETRRDVPTWERLRLRGMAKDFSWDAQGPRYEEVYRRLILQP